MLDQGPMPPAGLPPMPPPPGVDPAGINPDFMPQAMGAPMEAPADPAVEGLAAAIADAIRAYQEDQAAQAVTHPIVQSLLAPAPDPARAFGGGSLGPVPPPPVGFLG